jgi:response regulator RpfG family c-di-GMP phosphodiesterase
VTRKILFVDDEQALLDSFRNLLRRQFDVYAALGPEEGLKVIQGPEHFAVVVSDLKMPGMDGIAFLNRVRELAPDTVRMMLTGFADVDVATAAVNEGQVFRFLTKPCTPEIMAKALTAGLEQHRLVTAERELLRGTLRGAIQVLTEALSLANPEAYGRAHRIKALTRRMAKAAGIPLTWEMDLAAMLSHIGCMALPRTLLEKIAKGKELSEGEQKLYESHPAVGAGLLEHIPRLEHVAEMIGMQHDRHDTGVCAGGRCVIARLLKLATDYDMLESRGMAPAEILARLHADAGAYDPALLAALESSAGGESEYILRRVGIEDLAEGMVLEEGIVSEQGLLLLAKGTEVNRAALARMLQAARTFEVVEPFTVRVPRQKSA